MANSPNNFNNCYNNKPGTTSKALIVNLMDSLGS